jgi:hypothetical protein
VRSFNSNCRAFCTGRVLAASLKAEHLFGDGRDVAPKSIDIVTVAIYWFVAFAFQIELNNIFCMIATRGLVTSTPISLQHSTTYSAL